jgi:tripartite-type tricarboxylate transporter receptor subunit TctC
MIKTITLAVALSATVAVSAFAQSKTTRIIVSFAPGGPVDAVARTMADQLGKELGGRTVIIENKPGANGAIGAQEVLKSAPDGTTIWITSVGAAAVNPALYPKLQYDMDRDFAPVSVVVNNDELLVVNPKNPANDAPAFIAASKALDRGATMASSGIGSIPHLAIEQMADATGAQLLHVPYKGAAPAITDLLGGQVDGFFGDVPGLIGHVKAGRLKPLGMAAKHRHPALPEVKTLEEQGLKGVDTNNWYAFFVPAKTPATIIAELNKATRATLTDKGVAEKLLAMGAEPAPSTPEELAAIRKKDAAKWAALIKAKGIRDDE